MSRKEIGDGVGIQAGVRFFMGFMRPRPHHHEIRTVRQLLMSAAVFVLLGSPFYGEALHLELPFLLIGAVVLVSLSALTRAMEKSILTADAIAAGVGLFLYQAWAIAGFNNSITVAFVLREALAVLFMTVFYFSMMASRSMILNQVEDDEEGVEIDSAVDEEIRERVHIDLQEDLNKKHRQASDKAEVEASERELNSKDYDLVNGHLDKSGG